MWSDSQYGLFYTVDSVFMCSWEHNRGKHVTLQTFMRRRWTHLDVFWGVELFKGLSTLSSWVLQLFVPFQRAVFSAVLQPCVNNGHHSVEVILMFLTRLLPLAAHLCQVRLHYHKCNQVIPSQHRTHTAPLTTKPSYRFIFTSFTGDFVSVTSHDSSSMI